MLRKRFLPASRRRLFLSVVAGLSAGTAGLSGTPPRGPRAMPAAISHFVPPEKDLARGWVDSLFQRGVPECVEGADLRYIGMPVGGIGAGQLYLCGDGALGCWEIFNRFEFRGTGGKNYAPIPPDHPVDQGFAVVVDTGERLRIRPLNSRGFSKVVFRGEYPIGIVRYSDAEFPLEVRLEAFSPFIPLNAPDSGLPATVFAVTIKNRGRAPLRAACLGWLENAVCLDSGHAGDGVLRTRFFRRPNRGWVIHDARPLATRGPRPTRPPIVLQDFEGKDYGAWRVAGTAFGRGPAHGTLVGQQPVSGFLGKGLVNTFLGGDKPTGVLTSPPITINRRYINFLIGGGNHLEKTCVVLLVDGKRVRTSSGQSREQLAWESWDVNEFQNKTARIRIVDRYSGGWGHINVDQIELNDRSRAGESGPLQARPDFGTLVLALAEKAAEVESMGAVSSALTGPHNRTFVTGDDTRALPERQNALLMSRFRPIRPGEAQTTTFVLAWHFPNADHGHQYAARFGDASEVTAYVLNNLGRLSRDTRLWRDVWYDSTLPYWLLDRIHAPVSTLATGTCRWWRDGRFWAFEGVVCCAGTCTHVWNYAQAHAHLFPSLARSVRTRQDFCPRADGGGFHPDSGLVGFRGNDAYAADGQCGAVLKAYREHLLSADDHFLREYWPRIRRALEYSIAQDTGDGAADGIIENAQHNTYDISYVGANTFVGALYLAALRAGEEMARAMNDNGFARRCRRIFESGRRISLERLWNGEYFIQDVNLEQHPKHQYGRGCLSDQLFGQTWADLLGLGHVYPDRNVRSALAAIWKYNWAPDVWPQNRVHPPGRGFAAPGEPGLFTCTWPKSAYLSEGTLYKNEVWTGIEYEVATAMIWEGLVTRGLAICRGVHDRYRPCRRNPYNEVECGDHYARALASWGVLLALCGFEYNGPQARIGFAPKATPKAFRAAFTAAEGWGTFTQTRKAAEQTDLIAVKWGRLRLRSVALEAPSSFRDPEVAADLSGKSIACRTSRQGIRLVVTLSPEVRMTAGDVLRLTVR
ncbi:MAG: hypothetical protein GXP31_06210 [Kiritimatiellaeota bacterium]|nr:hypothetical protein [Kiritimatiellota bacterium]